MNPNPQKSPNAENEEKLLQFWRENNVFEKTLAKDAPKGEFNFFEGPPTANGRPGIHHVAARSFKDVIPRYKTMQGFSVRRKAGWDTHGLPVELQVEKQLGLKSKKEIEEFGVAEFNKKCRESVWEYREEWEKLTERMGFWLDMKNPYVTYDNSYIEALWGIVKRADERGHLYRDFKVLPWCARCGTALSSHELNQPGAYKDVKDLSVFAKFKIIGFEKAYFLAWTTTPWTLPGNVALAVGADIDYVEAKVGDEIYVLAKDLVKILPEGFEIIAEHKGSEMVGMQYEPLYPFMKNLVTDQDNKMVNAYKVYAADFVTTTDGTGIVHTAVMYGADDFELGTKIGLPKFHLVNEEGKFIQGTDFLASRFVKEKNDKGEESVAIDIIKDLAGRGLLFKKEKYEHSYPHCWRCDTPLIYYARTSWYFAMSKLREQLLAGNEKINWEPDHIKDGRFGEWLDGIKDWAISRDRYWGTPIPVWQSADGEKITIGSVDDLKKYTGNQITKIIFVRHGQAEHNVLKMSSSARDKHPLTELGQEQVRKAAEKIKDQDIDVVYASPILRARQTAEAYAKISGKEIIYDERIAEITSGNWEETTQLDPHVKEERDHYKNLPIAERYVYKRGGTGESWAEFDVRTGDFLNDILEKHAGKTIAVFSHQGTGSSLLKQIKRISNEEAVTTLFHNESMTGNAVVVTAYVHAETKRELDLHKPTIDNLVFEKDGKAFTRTTEVMDVWFDSGSMPIAQDHKLGEVLNFDPKPADYIAEGVDQTRGWFYTMHAIANMLHDEPAQAYNNVICMGLLMDANGQKMSKSRGNVVNPWEMFDKYGADVVRFWFYSVNQPGESKNFDEKMLDEVNKKVFNLLRNVVSFYEMYAHENSDGDMYSAYANPNANVLDLWILAKLDSLEHEVTEGLDHYQPLGPARAIRDFVAELSQWYIRRSRDRFKGDDEVDRKMALRTTRIVLKRLAVIMAPFTPFIAEEIFQKVNWDSECESVHLHRWMVNNQDEKYDFGTVIADMEKTRALVTLGLEARAKATIKVRQPLAKITVAKHDLGNDYLEILKDELNVKEVVIDESLEQGAVILDTEITPALKNEGDMRELSRSIQEMRKNANLMPSDRVIVSLVETEPDWFASDLGQEMMRLVGAEKVVWGNGEVKVEKIG